MSPVRSMDGSVMDGAERWIPPPSLPVREHAQVLDRRESGWPFLYSYREGRCVVNNAPRKSAYAQAEIGEALW